LLGILSKETIKSTTDSATNNIILCINIECNSCVEIVEQLSKLDQEQYCVDLIFHLTNPQIDFEKNPKFKSTVLLALLFKERGFGEFSKILIEASKRNLNPRFIHNKITSKYGLSISKEISNTLINKLLKQNNLLDQLHISKIPLIFLNSKLIPPIYKSNHYDLLT
jgi:hypothetical protein